MIQEKRAPNARENEMVIDLMVVRNTLMHNSEAVRDRLRGYPHAWRDMRLLLYLVNKLQGELLATMPDKRVNYYAMLCQHGKKIIDIPGPIPRGRHILMDVDDLAALTEAAMLGECAICFREGKEVKRCPIRAALLEAAPPAVINPDTWRAGCEYRNAASDLVQGKETTI